MWESLLLSTHVVVMLYKETKIPAIYKVIHKFYPIIIIFVVNQEKHQQNKKKKWYRKDLIVHHYECVKLILEFLCVCVSTNTDRIIMIDLKKIIWIINERYRKLSQYLVCVLSMFFSMERLI